MNLFVHCEEPCDLAQAIAQSECAAIKEIHMRGNLIPMSPLLQKCPIGLSAKQATLIAALSSRQGTCITSHAETAHLHKTLWHIDTTKVAIRELVDKLRRRGFFDVCKSAHDGIIQGMFIGYSAKCCPWLKLPLAPPHTPALAPPHTPALATPRAPALSSTFAAPRVVAATVTHASAPAPLLLKNIEEEEEDGFFALKKGKRELMELPDEFFDRVASNYSKNWPHLVRVGFDFPAFKNAAQKAPDKLLLLETWAQSLDYADYAWKSPETVKDGEGRAIRIPHIWIAGCFRKNSHYPRPAGYKTTEELAQEARAEEQRKEDEAECRMAYPEWRTQQSDDDIATLFECRCPPYPPEYIIQQRFQKLIWPELKKQR